MFSVVISSMYLRDINTFPYQNKLGKDTSHYLLGV